MARVFFAHDTPPLFRTKRGAEGSSERESAGGEARRARCARASFQPSTTHARGGQHRKGRQSLVDRRAWRAASVCGGQNGVARGRGRLVLVDLPDSWAFSRSVCWDCGSDRFPFGRRGAWTLLFFCSRPLSGSSGWVDTTDARDQRLFVSTPRFHFSLDSDKPRKDLSEMANGDLPLFTNCQPASDGRPPAKD